MQARAVGAGQLDPQRLDDLLGHPVLEVEQGRSRLGVGVAPHRDAVRAHELHGDAIRLLGQLNRPDDEMFDAE